VYRSPHLKDRWGLFDAYLELVFLPPYSPELNIVEGLWKWLKSNVINNVFYHTVADIRRNVGQFMDRLHHAMSRIDY
jgi:transposase